MLKAVIIDDERPGGETLQLLLNKYCPEVNIAALEINAQQGIDAIKAHRPQLVFLDIEMPMMSGFEILHQVKDIPLEIIFTTAYNHYGIQAIKHNALDYLLKPVDCDELMGAVKKAELKVKGGQSEFSKIESLIAQLDDKKMQKLPVHSLEGILFVDIQKIVRLNADSNYTHIFLTDKRKYTVARTLKEYEDILQPMNFFRVHNAHLINLSHVEKYMKGDGSHLIMADGSTVEVSRTKKNELLRLLSL